MESNQLARQIIDIMVKYDKGLLLADEALNDMVSAATKELAGIGAN